MLETGKQQIDKKLEELGKYLKVETQDKDWRERINKELRETIFSFKMYRVLGIIVMVGAGILMIISFFAKGETIYGVEIKENYFHFFMVIVMISSMFSIGGKSELKLDRIKTYLLLHDLKKES